MFKRAIAGTMAMLGTLGVFGALDGTARASYVIADRNGLWPNGIVPVCWASGINPEESYPRMIRAQVEEQWSRFANVTFTGWGNCPTSDPAAMPDGHTIFIARDDNNTPHSNIGRMFSDGTAPRPTVTTLNFNGEFICDSFPLLGNTNDDCVKWYSAHEFGHALGFLHEHDRPDFSGCFPWDQFWPSRGGGGIEQTFYDGRSIMNYCSDAAGTNLGQLSVLDIIGLQSVYGRKPANTLVGTGGRCVVPTSLTPGTQATLNGCGTALFPIWNYLVPDRTIRPTLSTNLCLDDAAGNTMPGVPVDIWPCDQRANSFWKMENTQIVTLGSRCFDRVGSGTADGTLVQLYVCNGNGNQRWTFTNAFEVRTGAGGPSPPNKCLDVQPGTRGTQAHIRVCNAGSTTQKFELVGGALRLRGTNNCLEVEETEAFFRASNNKPIRLRACSGLLNQGIYVSGTVRGAAGRCMSSSITNVSRDGVPVKVENCSGHRNQVYDRY